MAVVQYEYSIVWNIRHIINILAISFLLTALYFSPLEVFSDDPSMWIKSWIFLSCCVLLQFFLSIKVVRKVEIEGDRIKLFFFIIKNMDVNISEVKLVEENRPSKVKNGFGVRELKVLHNDKCVAYIPLNIKNKERFISEVGPILTS